MKGKNVGRTGREESRPGGGTWDSGVLPTHMSFRDADHVGGDCRISPVARSSYSFTMMVSW